MNNPKGIPNTFNDYFLTVADNAIKTQKKIMILRIMLILPFD